MQEKERLEKKALILPPGTRNIENNPKRLVMFRSSFLLPGLLALFLLTGCNSGKIPCPKPVGDSASIFASKKTDEPGILPMTKKPVERNKNGLLKKKKYNYLKNKKS